MVRRHNSPALRGVPAGHRRSRDLAPPRKWGRKDYAPHRDPFRATAGIQKEHPRDHEKTPWRFWGFQANHGPASSCPSQYGLSYHIEDSPFLPAKRHFGDSGIPAGAFRGFQNRFWAIRNRPGSVLSQSHTDKRHFADFWDPGRRQKGPPDAFGIPAAPRNPQFERSFLDRPFNPRIPKPFGGSGAGNESAGERFGIPRICRGAFWDPRGRRKRPREFPESRFRHFGGPGSPI